MGARLNVLMIVTDQEQAPGVLPPVVSRPALESLLESGCEFRRHHTVALPCGPSRSALYTGLHTEHTGVHGNPGIGRDLGMSATVPTVGTALRSHGYHTAYKGKWHVSAVPAPAPFLSNTVSALEDFGFSDYSPGGDPVGVAWDGYRNDPVIAAEAAAWLHGDTGGRPDDAPWFLAVNFVNPHDIMFFDATGSMNATRGSGSPRLPAPRDPLYDVDWDVELPASLDEDRSRKPAAHARMMDRVEAFLGPVPTGDPEVWRRFRSYYFNCLRDVDRHVGTVLRALEQSGQADRTVVVYTSDHGEAAGAHGMREKPISVYREIVNIPLVVRHPHATASTADLPTSALDIVPTVLDLAGISAREQAEQVPHLRGHSLAPALVGDSVEGRGDRGVLLSMREPTRGGGAQDTESRGSLAALITSRWKLARYSAAGEHLPVEGGHVLQDADLELYDTVADPDEVNDLSMSAEHADVLTDLAGRLAGLVRDEVHGVHLN